ncbi:MAG: acylneuraminate cytidylyltransferase family protein [Clostridiales bacterium]|jgi:CMP-N,N'-diacetyllegionaminic acid synthase|nr:acylneuraminate cytidylyltransferase family protein [Clostridiales bacterium]
MVQGRSFLGIIPARSGSKGLPHKNIRDFLGKPLLAWTIEAAQGSGVLDEIFVSTDSEEYAAIARRYGASVPFLRPARLSGDDSPASEYLVQTIRAYEALGKLFDYFVLLQPTSPLRTAEHIASGARTVVEEDLISAVAFSEFREDLRLVHPLPKDLNLSALAQAPAAVSPSAAASALPNDTLRQSAATLYRVNGLLYICRCAEYLETRSFYGARAKALLIDGKYAVDIDDETDFLYAELLAKKERRFLSADMRGKE